MSANDVLPPAAVLQRRAVVYVRQSTPQQVQSNLESQRRQYELADVAKRRGFKDVEIIDDDLGRSAMWWDGTGVCLMTKRLEGGQFP